MANYSSGYFPKALRIIEDRQGDAIFVMTTITIYL